MLDSIKIFDFNEHFIRTAKDKDGEPLVCAADLAKACGIKKVTNSYKRVAPEFKRAYLMGTNKGKHSLIFYTEPGVYQFLTGIRRIKGSNQYSTQIFQFQTWVFKEVLPSIRKTGKYEIKSEYEYKNPEEDQLIITLKAAIEVRQAQLELERKHHKLEIHVDKVEEKLTTEIDKAVKLAEATEASYTGRTGFKAVLGFARLNNFLISRNYLAVIGKQLSKYCRENNLNINKVQDERFNTVNTYPIDVLEKHRNLFEKYNFASLN